MRRHKAVALIFLSLSIVNFTFASVAQTRTMDEMRIDSVTGAEDMTEAPEALPEWLGRSSTAGHLHSRFDMAAAQSFKYADGPENSKFFNEELNRKMKEYLILGSIAGLFTGVANGIQKEVLGTVSPDAQTIGRSVEPLVEHHHDREDPVSHTLSKMEDEHLQMLSFISRRMLNSLD